MSKRILIISMLLGITNLIQSQTKLDVGISLGYHITSDTSKTKNLSAIYLGLNTYLNNRMDLEFCLKGIFAHGKLFYPFSYHGYVPFERYTQLNLLVPVNFSYKIPHSKVSYKFGPSFGIHNLRRWGSVQDLNTKNYYNYTKINFRKEFICAGFQTAIYYKRANWLRVFAELDWSKSKEQILASVNGGFMFFI